MGVVPPEPGFNALPRRDLPQPRRAVRQRRGDDRLPGLPARASGASTAPPRAGAPDLMTFGKVMGGGFPAAAFGGRADVMRHARAGGAGLPGRHAVREPGRDHRRPGHAAAGHRRRLRPPRRRRRRDQGRGRPTRSPRPASPHVVQAAGHDVLGLLRRRAAVPRLRRRPAHRRRGVRRVLPRHARPRRLPAAVGVRGVVPLRRPRRPRRADRARRPARRGPRRGRSPGEPTP